MTDLSLTARPDPDDLHCPVCDYALRGLPEPRCPECGYAFEWAELRERARRRQLWFYEHAGTLRSHLLTRWKSLRPWSFWKQIHAYSDADVKRLWKYQWATLLLLVGMLIVVLGLPSAHEWLLRALPQGQVIRTKNPPPGARPIGNYGPLPMTSPSGTTRPILRSGRPIYRRPSVTTQAYFVPPPQWAIAVQRWFVPRGYGYGYGYAYGFGRAGDRMPRRVGCMAALTAGVMMGLPLYWRLLRASVLQANIRPVHLARVDAYSGDVLPILLLVAATIEWIGFAGPDRISAGQSFGLTLAHCLLAPAVVVGGLTLRLISALRRYVRFPQAVPVALGYGVIAGLAWMIVVINVV